MEEKIIEQLCWNCGNAKRENGLTYSPCDLYVYDLPCKYIKCEREESEYPHKIIICPLINYHITECSYIHCLDCPIDWSKLRINFEIKEPNVKPFCVGGIFR